MGGGYNEASVVPNTEGLAGSEGHLEQLQRRVRPRPGRHLDEHEVGHEQLPRPGSAIMMRHESARREHVLEQRAEDQQAGVPRPRPRRHRSAARSSATSCSSSAVVSPAPPRQRPDGPVRRCRRRSSGSATSARRSSATRAGNPDSRAHLRSVQRRPGRAGPLSPRRDPERDHPESGPVRAADAQLLSAAEPHARRRVQPEQLRGDDSPDRAPLQLEQPRRSAAGQPLAVWQRRHLLRGDRHAAAVRASRRSTAPTASAATRTRTCRLATRSC